MLINKTAKFLLTVITIVVTPLKWVMIVPTYILLNAPLIKTMYELIITLVWLPFGAFITGISWLYKNVRVVGPMLSWAGIPIVLVGYALSYLMSPRSTEERAFIEACQSYPSIGNII